MKRLITTLTVLATMCVATSAFAIQYPPGTPGGILPGPYPDTLTVINLQNPAAVPFLAVPDTAWGIGGIITGFDPKPTGFGFYIQMSNGLPYSGADVFTGATNKQASPFNLALGDSVVVYGKKQEFGNGSEIEGLDASQSTDDVLVRVISSGNPLPAFHVGTVNELQELPTNPNAEQWEGMLVQINTPALKVARTSFTGGMSFNSFKLVDPTCAGPICDSVLVDGNTLTTYTPPAVNTVVSSVQGIYEQRTTYRIQLRDGNDIVVATPPSVNDAYPIEDNKIRVVFDRDVTAATATDLANYSLASFSTINSATMESPSVVILDITSTLVDGDPEALTVSGIAGLANGLVMTNPQTRNFTNGVMTIAMVQGPDPDSLTASAYGCADVARFLGTNNGASSRISVLGVCTGRIGSLYYIQDEAGGYRSGCSVFAPIVPLTVGQKYLVVGAMQDFPAGPSGESEIVGTVYIVGKGAGTIPAPVAVTVPEAANRTCDAAQAIITGEDVEGVLVKISYAKIVPFNDPFTGFVAGDNFRVVGPLGVEADTILIDNDFTPARTYLPVVGNVVSVTGLIQDSFGIFRVQPRGDFDILDHGAITGVPGALPSRVQFAVTPNPARTANVSFGLPVRNSVDLGVFDLQGRKVATLVRGTLEAGNYSHAWNGLDDSGRAAGSGVYFYRLKVGAETYTLRGIKLN